VEPLLLALTPAERLAVALAVREGVCEAVAEGVPVGLALREELALPLALASEEALLWAVLGALGPLLLLPLLLSASVGAPEARAEALPEALGWLLLLALPLLPPLLLAPPAGLRLAAELTEAELLALPLLLGSAEGVGGRQTSCLSLWLAESLTKMLSLRSMAVLTGPLNCAAVPMASRKPATPLPARVLTLTPLAVPSSAMRLILWPAYSVT
jgi:hypothetical protein